MLAGAMETVSGTEDSASSLTSTSGGLASTLAASGLGPVICHIFASPNNWTPFTCKLSDCGSSVGLTIAIVRNLRSLLNAAETSNGYVGLPGLVAGCSPPTGLCYGPDAMLRDSKLAIRVQFVPGGNPFSSLSIDLS